MGTSAIQIDPNTGERITATMIDPATGERISTPQKGFFSSYADGSGLSALVHPIDTALGLPAAVKQMAVDSYANAKQGAQEIAAGQRDKGAQDLFTAIPIVGPATRLMSDQFKSGNTAGALGTALGTATGLAAPEALKGAATAAPEVAAKAAQSTARTMQSVGESAQAAGAKLVNETVGSYKADFKRGANPGRGYLSTGNGTAWTMQKLADKAQTSLQDVGSNIQKVISASGQAGTKFSVDSVISALQQPLKEAWQAENEAGGMGNTGAFEQYAQQFKKTIADGIKNGGFTAQDVFDLKKQIAKKAKFNNTTPEGIMDVRQSQVGALGGLLKQAIPELAPLNQAYQDLVKLADRAQWRAESGSIGLRRILGETSKGAAAAVAGHAGGLDAGAAAYGVLQAVDSTAGRTGIASTLYNGGKGLSAAGSKLQDYLGRAR